MKETYDGYEVIGSLLTALIAVGMAYLVGYTYEGSFFAKFLGGFVLIFAPMMLADKDLRYLPESHANAFMDAAAVGFYGPAVTLASIIGGRDAYPAFLHELRIPTTPNSAIWVASAVGIVGCSVVLVIAGLTAYNAWRLWRESHAVCLITLAAAILVLCLFTGHDRIPALTMVGMGTVIHFLRWRRASACAYGTSESFVSDLFMG